MIRILFFLILLGLPIADLYVTARFAEWTGVPVWVWLLGGAIAGVWLIRHERITFRTKTVASMQGPESLLGGVFDSGRKVLAGLLLLIPGIVSDLIAVLLLALPINSRRRFGPEPAPAGNGPGRARGDLLDGEYRRLD